MSNPGVKLVERGKKSVKYLWSIEAVQNSRKDSMYQSLFGIFAETLYTLVYSRKQQAILNKAQPYDVVGYTEEKGTVKAIFDMCAAKFMYFIVSFKHLKVVPLKKVALCERMITFVLSMHRCYLQCDH